MKKMFIPAIVAIAAMAAVSCNKTEFSVSDGQTESFKKELVNFSLHTQVLMSADAEAAISFHSDGKGSGYDILLNNGAIDGSRKTGSLASVRNLYRSLAEDDEWFDLDLAVRGKNISVAVNGTDVVCYTEPEKPFRTPEHAAQLLGKGGIYVKGGSSSNLLHLSLC